jgi:hypothetical protein
MNRRLLLLSLLLVAAAFPLTGCGGGNSDEDQINDVITTVATTNNPSNCTELMTQRFLEQLEFTSGADAVKQCKSSGRESNADSVDVSNIEIEGDTATADAAVTGAAFDGQTIKLSLVKEGDQWKIDHLESFVEFDQQAFADAFAKVAQEGKQPATVDQANCIRGKLAATPSQTLQQAVLSGNSDALGALIGACFH